MKESVKDWMPRKDADEGGHRGRGEEGAALTGKGEAVAKKGKKCGQREHSLDAKKGIIINLNPSVALKHKKL